MKFSVALRVGLSGIAPPPTFGIINGEFCASFAAKSEGFGPLRILVEEKSGFTVSIGRFTHAHFDCPSDAPVAIGDVVSEVVHLCREIFADQIVCCLLLNGGGYFHRSKPTPFWARWLGRDFWVWSGPVAHPRTWKAP